MMRATMAFLLPDLEMFGGNNPDAWFAPMISDIVIGALVPLMIYLTMFKTGIKVWGTLLIYNAIGIFDYAHGLMTQWTDPLVPNGIVGTPALTFGAVAFSMLVQIFVLILLFQPKIINHFTKNS